MARVITLVLFLQPLIENRSIQGFRYYAMMCLLELFPVYYFAFDTELGDPYFLLLNYDQHDKMQLFAKFKKCLWSGFRATLDFRKLSRLNLLK